MKAFSFFILIHFSSMALATDGLKIYDGKVYKSFVTKEYQGMRFTEGCLEKNPPTCDAYKATLTPAIEKKKFPTPLVGHPAAQYCLDAGGENRIAKGRQNEQYDYCLFKDGSMIDSWDLYFKFHKADEKK
ncbi:DUF333 domain-containing protein [Bdellovibrio sp. HCB2-146]|uniref:DUF333 domain-containing protein n=1 Tax=Bdellovibrio sp. HCB2-146 TaxID=3394362 RepID=UPI0039BC8CBC